MGREASHATIRASWNDPSPFFFDTPFGTRLWTELIDSMAFLFEGEGKLSYQWDHVYITVCS